MLSPVPKSMPTGTGSVSSKSSGKEMVPLVCEMGCEDGGLVLVKEGVRVVGA